VSRGLRVAIAGATGTLGREVVCLLEEQGFPLAALELVASERSTGTDVDFRGDVLPVGTDMLRLESFDLLIVCTPAGVALEWVRAALHAETPCIDCSGVLVGAPEVPVLLASLSTRERIVAAPVVTTPAGSALAWALALAPLQRAAGLERVVGTVLRSASMGGRAGIEALSEQTIALLSQGEAGEHPDFPGRLAFDCMPQPLAAGEQLAAALARLLAPVPPPALAVTSVLVPSFVGEASALSIETSRELPPEEAARVLADAPGVELWEKSEAGPSTRDAGGRDVVLVGRPRADDSLRAGGRSGLLLWLAADPVRLAAANALALARARLELPQ